MGKCSDKISQFRNSTITQNQKKLRPKNKMLTTIEPENHNATEVAKKIHIREKYAKFTSGLKM